MGLTDLKKNYIQNTIEGMLKTFGSNSKKNLNDIYNKIEEMVNKQDQCEMNGTPSTAFHDFSKLYYDLFTDMVLPYAVEKNDGVNYGQKFEGTMNVIYTTLPKNFIDALEKKNPMEIPEYNKLVKNAFLTKMDEYKDKAHGNTYKHVFGNEESEYTSLEELNNVTTQFARINAFYFGASHDKNGNFIKDQKIYDEHKASANKMLGVVAIKYQQVKAEYNQLNFFQKWFWHTGYDYRSQMENTVHWVKEVNQKFNLSNAETKEELYYTPIKELLKDTADRVQSEVNQIKESAESFNPTKKIEIDLGEEAEPVTNPFKSDMDDVVLEAEHSIN